ncbi:MAG TPA: hypothetical protein PKA12_11385 [Saprospiraceae bacterium]|nr:hypothetical protein [Saprospiraceae bacterium]
MMCNKPLLFVVAWALISLAAPVLGQEIPYLKNFFPNEYKAASQNWSIDQGDNQVMYIGNDQGLLRFDGGNWNFFSLSEGKSIRSVHCHKNRIYTGAYGEFGYWEEAGGNELKYTSLTHLVRDSSFFKEEVWHITSFQDKIYFQSFGRLFIYDGLQVNRIEIPGTIMFLSQVEGRLYLPAINKGLYISEQGGWKLVTGTERLANLTITGLLPFNGGILACTNEDAAYFIKQGKCVPWNHVLNQQLKKLQINKALYLGNGLYTFATIKGGVVLYNHTQNTIVTINTAAGLQNNTVLSLCRDREKGLWLGLDKGLAYISLSSAIRYYDGRKDNLGTIYTAAVYGKYKYLGTNQGLYRCAYKPNEKEGSVARYLPMPGVQGQVWHLLKTEGGLICAHNTGCDLITDQGTKPLFRGTGSWYTQEIEKNKHYLLQGTYNGLVVYVNQNGWKFSHKVRGSNGAIERLAQEGRNTFWLTGPGGDLRKIVLNDSITAIVTEKEYTGKNKLPMSRQIEIGTFKSKVYVKLNDSLLRYNHLTDAFVTEWKGVGSVKGPIDSTYFVVYRDSLIILEGKTKKTMFIQPSLEYNAIGSWDENQIYILREEGYVLIEKSFLGNLTLSQATRLEIDYLQSSRGVKMNAPPSQIILDYEDRSFEMYFHTPVYDREIYYRYLLEGRDSIRGEWDQHAHIQFHNLNDGVYQLTLFSSGGDQKKIVLKVLAPWYLSAWAIVTYIILAISCFVLLGFYYSNALKKSKLKILRENERLLREHMIALDNEKLKEENRLKSQDLANSTLHLIKKNELLLEIKEELVEIRKSEEGLTQKEYQKMMRQINENLSTENDNKLFEANFHEIHEVFFRKLLARYPELTSQDLKLAAYLKMNLATKEIAPLFNISIRGLENKRYRLRMKLGLTPEVNLSEFFIGFE